MAVPDKHDKQAEPPNAQPALYVAKCVLRSSVVLQAVYCHLRSPATLDVVFGKETALELAVVCEDGVLQSVCEQPVFGAIKDLRVLPWNAKFRSNLQSHLYGKDLLVLLSDSGNLSFLTFNIDFHRFLAVTHVYLAHPGNLRQDLGWTLAVEPRGQAIAVGAFEDRVAVYPTSVDAGNHIVEKKMIYPRESTVPLMSEPTTGRQDKASCWGAIWSMAFVKNTSKSGHSDELVAPTLVVLLHRNGSPGNEVHVLKCDTKECTISLLAQYDPSEVSPGHLTISVIDMPYVPGYIMLARLGDILLLDLRTPNTPFTAKLMSVQKQTSREQRSNIEDGRGHDSSAASALDLLMGTRDSPKQSSICAWSWEPESGSRPRLVLGMDSGEILIAEVFREGSEVVRMQIHDCHYQSAPCRSLLWIKGGFIAALIEMGDGQILDVKDGKLTCQSQIQNVAPILDFALVDYHGEKQNQMFACCGVGQEGSIRVIQNGISVDKLLSTPPVYEGVTGIWTMRLSRADEFHSFFVMSFVEETRVLSVGLNFVDVTEAVGFCPFTSTLTSGLIENGWLAQVCSREVLLCAPTRAAHTAGMNTLTPLQTSWKPRGSSISLGAVAHGTIVLALSKPGVLLVLGTVMGQSGIYELVELQQCLLDAEVSCICIPQEEELVPIPVPPSIIGLMDDSKRSGFPPGIEVGKVCVVGTHKPSVDLRSIVPGENLKPLAVGLVALFNSVGAALGGCVPESVRLALFDRLYIICGLRNGMLLRYEWPLNLSEPMYVPEDPLLSGHKSMLSTTDYIMRAGGNKKHRFACFTESGQGGRVEIEEAVQLHLVAVRRLGVLPVSLIPLQASLRADIIALSDRPWLLQTARHSQRIAYTSISFRPSTHATPVSFSACPNGILFLADCSLNLVEAEHSKRLNVQKLPLGRTARRVLYHSETKMLVVMRSEQAVSDLCCVDPVSGSLHSCFQLDDGEIARCMQLWQLGCEQLILVGTGLTNGKAIMPNGEPESSKGRLLVFRIESKHMACKSKGLSSSSFGVSPFFPASAASSSVTSDPVSLKDVTAAEEVCQDGHMLVEGEGWELSLVSQISLQGMVLAVCPYLEQYVLASAGNSLLCLGFAHDSLQRLRRFAVVKTRFVITTISSHLTRIAVGDCRDGVLFYSYREDTRKLEQLHCDPVQRLVADCILKDVDTAIVTDRSGNFCSLSSANAADESISPERNLSMSCWYHMGEIMMNILKGSFAYRVPLEETKSGGVGTAQTDGSHSSLVASTLLGSVVIFSQVTREEYLLLEAVQARLALHPLTAPLLGNNHAQYRGKGCPVGVCSVLDGDMLHQFLELTNAQQQMVLPGESAAANEEGSKQSSGIGADWRTFPLEQILRLLEKIHNSLT